MFKHFSERT